MKMGMWWPDANSGSLRAAAGHWRDYADAVDEVCRISNGKAASLIRNNKGEAIDAFEVFWGRYHRECAQGWLDDLAAVARQMAKALEEFADAVDDAIQQLWTEIGIAAATIAAGVGLAVFTFGLSTAASAAAAATIIELAAGLGITVSTTVANIAAITLTGVVFGSIESVTVELAVAQPLKISTGLQDGFNLSQAQDAAAYGAAFGGALGAGAGTVRAASDAGGFVKMFQGIPINVRGPELAYPNGHLLLRQGDYNAWPRSKRKGATQPKYRADLPGDEGMKGSHTLDRHADKTDQELRSRLREDKNITGSSSFLDESSAQKVVQARFDEVTGRSLSREDFIRGTGPHDAQGVKLIIRRDPDMPNGYRIHTAYPTS
ncbi:RNase A-like domain-containing protein [Streptomyces xantholiticus]